MPEAGFLRSSLLEAHGINAVFSQRHTGVSPPPFDSLNMGDRLGDASENIHRNLELLCKQAGLTRPPHQARQVHGIDVIQCGGTGCMQEREADILIASEPDCAVAVRTADCLPILLAEPRAKLVAAVHAGWRGTVQNAVGTAINSLTALGGEPARILASLGPCIGPCCFEVDERTAESIANACPGAEKLIAHTPTPHPNLAAINQLQLTHAGVKMENIEMLSTCSSCHPELYFSHRRDKGLTGRQIAVVALRSTAYTTRP